MIYIIIIAIFILVGIYVAYEVKRSKRIRKESTKLDSGVYRRKDGNR